MMARREVTLDDGMRTMLERVHAARWTVEP
jgi:hypothetical protein